MRSKLTKAAKAEIRAIIVARNAIPTNQQLADSHGVCRRVIDNISMQVARDVPCGTPNATSLHDVRG